MSAEWLKMDEVENAVDYLEWTASFLASPHLNRWKWVVIALHGALYGFAACVLRGGDPGRVPERSKPPNLWEALTRCQEEAAVRHSPDSRPLVLSSDETWWLEKLWMEYRKNFEQFPPRNCSVEVAAMAVILKHASRVIRFLALESGNVKLNAGQQERVNAALAAIAK